MERISNTVNNDQTELSAPPPYTSVVYKIKDSTVDLNTPPSYASVYDQSVIYINNYPGPPLSDGCVQDVQDAISITNEIIMSKRSRIYSVVNGIITIIFGLICAGLQVGLLCSHSIIYYYYGFWGGTFLICMGISTIVLFTHRYNISYSQIFHSFFWQMILTGVILGVGTVIIITDKCDDNDTEDDHTCRPSHAILNGCLLGTFSSAFLQSIINTFAFGILTKRHPIILNSSIE